MAVLLPEDRRAWWAPRDLRCFACGLTPPGPLVFWTGDAGVLVLCPDHAAALGAHLLQDAREAVLAAGDEPRWASRATRAAVAAIERKMR